MRLWLIAADQPTHSTRWGDSQDSACGGNGILGPARLYELVRPRVVESASKAFQAATFARISSSSLSLWFSRRRALSSSRSAVVRPSWRRPASRSACCTQLRIVWAVGSNSLAKASGVGRIEPTRSSAGEMPSSTGTSPGHRGYLLHKP